MNAAARQRKLCAAAQERVQAQSAAPRMRREPCVDYVMRANSVPAARAHH